MRGEESVGPPHGSIAALCDAPGPSEYAGAHAPQIERRECVRAEYQVGLGRRAPALRPVDFAGELETAARYKLNAVIVVNTNYSGGVMEKVVYDRGVNFSKVAESLGCFGIRIDNPADIRGALEKALASGRPAVVDVVTDSAIQAKRGWVPPAISGE